MIQGWCKPMKVMSHLNNGTVFFDVFLYNLRYLFLFLKVGIRDLDESKVTPTFLVPSFARNPRVGFPQENTKKHGPIRPRRRVFFKHFKPKNDDDISRKLAAFSLLSWFYWQHSSSWSFKLHVHLLLKVVSAGMAR